MYIDRSVSSVRAIDPTLFSPIQFHPHALLEFGVNDVCAWFIKYLGVSIARQLKDYQQSMVVVGCEINYARPFQFFDAAEFTAILDKVRLRQSNTVLEFFHVFAAQEEVFARVILHWKLLRLDGAAALSAVSGHMHESLLVRFKEEEIDSSPIQRKLLTYVSEVECSSPVCVEDSLDITLHRHQCEVADQWTFFQLTSLVAQARECLVMSKAAAQYRMSKVLGVPLKQVAMELSCPVYLFELMRVHTKLYKWQGQWVFIHRIYNVDRGHALAATVVERFE